MGAVAVVLAVLLFSGTAGADEHPKPGQAGAHVAGEPEKGAVSRGGGGGGDSTVHRGSAENSKATQPKAVAARSYPTDIPEEIGGGMLPAPDAIVRLSVMYLGSVDINAYIAGDKVFLPMGEMFRFLEIDIQQDPERGRANGFFLVSDRKYSCNFVSGFIKVGDSSYYVDQQDILLRSSDTYLALNVYSTVFGLHLLYDADNLLVTLRTTRKLPVFRKREREMARKYIRYAMGDFQADWTIPRERHWFNGAIVDWSLGYGSSAKGTSSKTYSMNLGAEVAGGDFSTRINGSDKTAIDPATTPWRWRFVENESWYLKQVSLGYIATAFSGKYFSLKGAQISNVPITGRRGFSTEVIEEEGKPGWEVEIYLNGNLHSWQTIDSTGKYRFEAPLNYGTNVMTLRLYGPRGEEETRIRRLDIPVKLVPSGEFEYSFTGGKLMTSGEPYFFEGGNRVGVSDQITAGYGVQYVGYGTGALWNPYVSSSLLLHSNILMEGEYVHNDRVQASMRLISRVFPELQMYYAVLQPNAALNPMGAKYERRASASYVPPRGWFFNGVTASVQERGYSSSSFVFMNAAASFSLANVHLMLQSRLGWSGKRAFESRTYSESSISALFQLPKAIFLTTQLNYDQIKQQIMGGRASLNYRPVPELWCSAVANFSVITKSTNLQFTVSYNLPFAEFRAQTSALSENDYFQGMARGTLAYDSGIERLLAGNQEWVGRGGMTIVPFIDDNDNDVLDKGETVLQQSAQVRLNSTGKRMATQSDLTRFVNVLPYDTYLMEIDPEGFEDPSVKPKYRSCLVTADPNQQKTVTLPVYRGGDIEGAALRKSIAGSYGMSGIKFQLKNVRTEEVSDVPSFSDGSFYIHGVRPGRYILSPDTAQLRRLKLTPEPETIEIEVRSIEGGDRVGGIQFLFTQDVPKFSEALRDTVPSRPQEPEDLFLIPTEPLADAKMNANPSKPVVRRAAIVPNRAQSVSFNPNDKRVDSTANLVVENVASVIKMSSHYIVRVEGHSDNFGSLEETQKRSEERAQVVRKMLITKGIAPDSILIQAYGSRRPIASNTTAEGRRKNNRVDITVVDVQTTDR